MFISLFQAISFLFFSYLAFCGTYLFVFALAGLFRRNQLYTPHPKKGKTVVILCAYKGDEVILSTAKDALKQRYPSELYTVLVIADSLQASTIAELRTLPLEVLEVVFEESTKSKSLIAALNYLPENTYDQVVILDIDNLMEPDFLEKVNSLMQRGCQVIQAHRTAKNQNTSFAILDALSEEINNHIFRKGHRALGLSSALIGSGMVFEYALFKRLMADIKAVGGFDKELEIRILTERIHIEYADNALVFDEKVMKAEVFGKQRTRWISAQVNYMQKHFLPGMYQLLFRFNVDYFDKLLQVILLPRILVLGFTIIGTTAACILPLAPALGYWALLATLTFGSFLLAIPTAFYRKSTFQALFHLPKAFFILFITLFKLKGANKKFIHTPHETL